VSEELRIRVGVAFVAVSALVFLAAASGLVEARASRSQALATPSTLPPTGGLQAQMGPAQGKFLVASRELEDPNFSQTVVLLLKYDPQGAVGLVIDRPTEMTLSMLLPEIKGLEGRPDAVYLGGPVAMTQFLMLVRAPSQPEGARQVFADVYVSSSRELLLSMIADSPGGESFRVYAGYAGWAPGQLDREVARGGWHVMSAASDLVFDEQPSQVWPRLIARTSVQWAAVYGGRLSASAADWQESPHDER
jgi:putative transcriptional regulator